MYATHKKYGNRIFHINTKLSEDTYFLFAYHMKKSIRSSIYSPLYEKRWKEYTNHRWIS